MSRRLNVRLLVWSLLVVAVALGGLWAVHRWQMRHNADAFLRQAERALDNGQTEQALRHLTHYLSYYPEDIEARIKYATACERKAALTGDVLSAIVALERVLWLDPDQREVRFRLVHMLIRSSRYRDAVGHLDQLVAVWPKPAEIEHMRGWCLEASAVGDADYRAAAAAFARAVALEPAYLDSYALWAEVLADRLRHPEKASAIMERMVQANPENAKAAQLRARFYQRQAGK